MVLGEVADRDLMTPLDCSGVDGDILLFDAGAVSQKPSAV
jgi:hypothetical protein